MYHFLLYTSQIIHPVDVLESHIMPMMPVIALASGSPRRREMLEWTGFNFITCPVDIDESWYAGEPPNVYVARLAKTKAETAIRLYPGAKADFFLAADTTVADRGEVLGKPTDDAEARRMLVQLRGRAHEAFTALALYRVSSGEWLFDRCHSWVTMRDYTNEEMEAYIRSGDPLDKAGAYAIQHAGFHPVIGFNGCFANVKGLPLCHLVRNMRKFGVDSPINTALSCQQHLDYDCPVTRAVLAGEDVG